MAVNETTPQFDAIVIGSGITGGWAAKEFTEKGVKTLLLERGRAVEHVFDYPTENLNPWDMKFRDKVDPKLVASDYFIQQECYAFKDSTKHFFASDKAQPYSQEEGKPFSWIRGNQLGGKSLLWHRQCYRWSDLDFAANKTDGHGVDWPIRYKDLEKWYDYVETFVGVSGSHEGIAHLPDGQFLPPHEMNCVEREIKTRIAENYTDRQMIIGRCAHLTEPQPVHMDLGRGTCQARNQCQRGCSFGAFFCSQSATLPAANRTGNLTTATDSIVDSLIYDPVTGRATGVRVINAKTRERQEYTARVIFLCASTLGSTQILLNSTGESFPDGFANSSGALGHYLMDHTTKVGAVGTYPGHMDKYYSGRRPTGVFIPRFRNVKDVDQDYLRGYGYQGGASRRDWHAAIKQPGIGVEYKQRIRTPGAWEFRVSGFGEMLPDYTNHVRLHKTRKDKWGIPQLHIDCTHGENEIKMKQDMVSSAVEMLETIGLQNVRPVQRPAKPGIGVHEMGTARMGYDPSTSVLNSQCQTHDVDNVFVTDGAAMASSAWQNPSITYMALTARAVDYAVSQMQQGKL